MKTIICGPPHSGKSVFLSNLVRLMPTDSFQRIMANGDGEGTWSNNPDQVDVKNVRTKSGNTPEEFSNWKKRIIKATQDIVLIDIGGRLQDDKIPLFEASDSFIVVSNNEDDIVSWINFGESHGCRCIGTILSFVDGFHHDEICATEPFFKGKIAGLERGHQIIGSKVLRGIADTIVCESNYRTPKAPKEGCLDFFDIGKKLGFAKTWIAHNGVEVNNIFFDIHKARVLYDYLVDTYQKNACYKLFGAKVNWVACIAAICLGNKALDNLEFYDEWTDSYISPHILSLIDNPNNKDLDIKVISQEDGIRLNFKNKCVDLDVNEFKNYHLPVIDESKPLLISGRFPNWFTVSVLNSYKNPVKYLHVPGIGFYCVESDNLNDLGSIIH